MLSQARHPRENRRGAAVGTVGADAGTDKPPVQLMEDVVVGKVSSS
jgi:hypothetical protein